MATTSWKTAGTVANDTGVGVAPWEKDDMGGVLVGTECSSDNNVYAGVNLSPSQITNWLKATNFGFTSADVPTGATIDGIEIEVLQFRNDAIAVASTMVKLVKGGTISGSDIGVSADWAASETPVNYGSSSQLGGLSWSQSDVVASNFGVALSVTNGPFFAIPIGRNKMVDQIRMRVYYTAGGTNWTDSGNANVSFAGSSGFFIQYGPDMTASIVFAGSSGSQHDQLGAGSANVTINAICDAGIYFPSNIDFTASATGKVTYFSGGQSVVLIGAHVAPQVTFFMTGAAAVVVSQQTNGLATRFGSASPTININAVATAMGAEWTDSGNANVSFAGSASGQMLRLGAGNSTVDFTTTAAAIDFQSGSGAATVTVGALTNGSAIKLAGGSAIISFGSTATGGYIDGSGTATISVGASATPAAAFIGAGDAQISITDTADGIRIAFGAGSGSLAITTVGDGTIIHGQGGSANIAVDAVSGGRLLFQEGATAGIAIFAGANGMVTQFGAGDAAFAVFSDANGVRTLFEGGSGTLSMIAAMDGVRVAQGAGTVQFEIVGVADGSSQMVGAGSGTISIGASTFFPSQLAQMQSIVSIDAVANARIIARTGANVTIRVFTNVDSAFDYIFAGKITFEIDCDDTVRFIL